MVTITPIAPIFYFTSIGLLRTKIVECDLSISHTELGRAPPQRHRMDGVIPENCIESQGLIEMIDVMSSISFL
jgi:hypothetical protein